MQLIPATWSTSLHLDHGRVHGWPRGLPRAAREIEGYGPIIAAAERELPIAEAHLAKAQAILGEAVLPGKVDVISAPTEFNLAICRSMAL